MELISHRKARLSPGFSIKKTGITAGLPLTAIKSNTIFSSFFSFCLTGGASWCPHSSHKRTQ